MKLRCTNCRGYFSKLEHDWFLQNGLQRICSSECMNEYRESRRTKSKGNNMRYSKKKQSRMIPPDLRHAVTDRDKRCRVCGGSGSEVHHIKFRSQGGANELSNLIFLCNRCHHDKAHGVEAGMYAELFRGYLWVTYVTGKSPSWGQVLDQCGPLVAWTPRVTITA